MIAGCGADLFVNICLTILGYVFSSFILSVLGLNKPGALAVVCALLSTFQLTIGRYFPGHIHAFYLEYVYFERRSQGQIGNMAVKRAPGVYSDNINSGGRTTYGTVAT